ncbi:helix-turn-helix transcriptional regulator [Rhizobiaceae bacterium n13]|uniref:Helix-turn-helix transcriptional regulator n=1 Tax=Ferirhizobium litorale TaxID=2927786 RepID=A0AAE3QIV2_9HYPH|nr:helix-turn-helix domain-containing protein [Fererhizobium litorale]MDI7862903.1 helix-turn-helix transcriptional regulator [Fererhizobium litorale]MDI7923989.1 helix-turn-helix transcriptional regulator [Fererhizobium litorale]
MVTNIDSDAFAFCETLTDAQDALAREILERASAKWPLRIMYVLAETKGPLRFSRLLERVEGISQKVLTQALRTLESDGLVTRTLYPQVPPRVEYELTPLGGELLLQVVALWRWIAERVPDFEKARARSAGATHISK